MLQYTQMQRMLAFAERRQLEEPADPHNPIEDIIQHIKTSTPNVKRLALEAMVRAAADDPQFVEAVVQMGVYEEALGVLQKSLAYPEVLLAASNCLWVLGSTERGKTLFVELNAPEVLMKVWKQVTQESIELQHSLIGALNCYTVVEAALPLLIQHDAFELFVANCVHTHPSINQCLSGVRTLLPYIAEHCPEKATETQLPARILELLRSENGKVQFQTGLMFLTFAQCEQLLNASNFPFEEFIPVLLNLIDSSEPNVPSVAIVALGLLARIEGPLPDVFLQVVKPLCDLIKKSESNQLHVTRNVFHAAAALFSVLKGQNPLFDAEIVRICLGFMEKYRTFRPNSDFNEAAEENQDRVLQSDIVLSACEILCNSFASKTDAEQVNSPLYLNSMLRILNRKDPLPSRCMLDVLTQIHSFLVFEFDKEEAEDHWITGTRVLCHLLVHRADLDKVILVRVLSLMGSLELGLKVQKENSAAIIAEIAPMLADGKPAAASWVNVVGKDEEMLGRILVLPELMELLQKKPHTTRSLISIRLLLETKAVREKLLDAGLLAVLHHVVVTANADESMEDRLQLIGHVIDIMTDFAKLEDTSSAVVDQPLFLDTFKLALQHLPINDEDLRKSLFTCIVCVTDLKGTQFLDDCGGLTAIAEMLNVETSNAASVRGCVYACDLLQRVAEECKTNAIFFKHNIVDTLLKLVIEKPTGEIQSFAAGALWLIAINLAVLKYLSTSDIIPPLLTMLQIPDQPNKADEYAAALLWTLAGSKTCRQRICELNGVAHLVFELSATGHGAVQALDCLSCLAYEAPTRQFMLSHPMFLEAVKQFIIQHFDGEAIEETTRFDTHLYRNLALEGEAACAALLASNEKLLIDTVAIIRESHDPEVIASAKVLLGLLASHRSFIGQINELQSLDSTSTPNEATAPISQLLEECRLLAVNAKAFNSTVYCLQQKTEEEVTGEEF